MKAATIFNLSYNVVPYKDLRVNCSLKRVLKATVKDTLRHHLHFQPAWTRNVGQELFGNVLLRVSEQQENQHYFTSMIR